MAFGTNLSLSVVKREDRTISEVRSRLSQQGWEETGSLRGRIFYYQNSGINLTVVDGPRAVLIFPSGPLRGRFFTDSPFGLTSESGLGLGKKTDTNNKTTVQGGMSQSRDHARNNV